MNQEEFFNFLWDGQDGLTSMFFKRGKETRNRHYSFPDQLPEILKTVREANDSGFECFFTPALLSGEGRKKDNFKVSNVAWADFDSPPQGALEPNPSVVVETSPGHCHVYWKLEDPYSNADQLEQVNKKLAHAFGADDCWDATRLLRVPQTNNYKRDAHSVEVIKFNPGTHTFSFEEGVMPLKEMASHWRPLFYKSRTIHGLQSSSWTEARGIVRLRSINSLSYWEKEELDLMLLRQSFGMQTSGGESSLRGRIMKLASRIFS